MHFLWRFMVTRHKGLLIWFWEREKRAFSDGVYTSGHYTPLLSSPGFFLGGLQAS
jgi:hypothetical protein